MHLSGLPNVALTADVPHALNSGYQAQWPDLTRGEIGEMHDHVRLLKRSITQVYKNVKLQLMPGL
jgi:hypothetical protein